jgi:hypothetical protein
VFNKKSYQFNTKIIGIVFRERNGGKYVNFANFDFISFTVSLIGIVLA